MPVVEDSVGVEIVRYLAKARFERRLTSRAADAGFSVANDPARAIDYLRGHQRTQGKIRRRGITAWICDQTGAPDALAIELRKAINRLLKKSGRGMPFLVPARIALSVPKPE